MRSVACRFPDLASMRSALERAGPRAELPVPLGERVGDGEWVLAVFEVGPGLRSMAAASRGHARSGLTFLTFESRDWERLSTFVGSNARVPRLGDDDEPPTERPMESEAIAIPLVNVQTPLPPASSLIAPDTLRPPPPPNVHPSAKGARVLVVDGDPEVREVVAAMLEAVDLVVEGARTAEEALDMVHGRGFDLLVVDWTLPQMSGLELCKIIRDEPRTATLPLHC